MSRVRPGIAWLRVAAACLGVSMAALAGSCALSYDFPPPVTGDCCFADPVAHFVFPAACDTSADCPSGTVCDLAKRPRAVDEALAPWLHCSREGHAHGAGTCRIPTSDTFDANILVNGFKSGSFILHPGSDPEHASFTFEAPPDTLVVACALFSCIPEISSETHPALVVNYDACVVASVELTGPSGLFSLGDTSIRYRPAGAPACISPLDEQPRLVTRSLAGCWAYDKTHIIAASQLTPVDLAATAFSGLNADCTLDESSGKSCFEAGRYGICHDGDCLRRCVLPEDCGAPGDFACDKEEGLFVGACVQ